MPESRKQLFLRIASIVGAGSLAVEDPRDGWPGIAVVKTDLGNQRVALHVGPIGPSHRGRDEVERRFQNPGKGRAMYAPPGSIPLLIGLWEHGERPLLVGMEAEERLGRETRQSLFVRLELLHHAVETGWSEHVSSSNELIVGFHPALLPAYVQMRMSGAVIPTEEVLPIIDASGLMAAPELETPEQRARRALSSLVRSASFSRRVIEAYEGLCAMCGLNLGLVEAAHIFPVSAPNSPDETWNGLALCANHHSAFDRHMIWIEPGTLRALVRPDVVRQAGNEASSAFLSSTLAELRQPLEVAQRPRQEMFSRRYEHFGPNYGWAK